MSAKLLIIGGTITPYKNVQAEQDRLLDQFLGSFSASNGDSSSSKDNRNFWFELDQPYYPFKTAPVHQHRASQDAVTGLAELILQKEAADIGITSDITALGDVMNARWQLTNPAIFDDYDLVAFSTTYLPSMLLVPVLGALRIPPRIKLFIGGPGASKVNHGALRGARFDYLLRTEAEGRFRQLLQHAQGEDIDLDEIPGLTWRENGELHRSPQITAHLDLDTLPLPDYTKMADFGGGRVLYESVRGCPYRCEFCDYPFLMGNKAFRYKGAQRIHDDWKAMNETMGVRDILSLDSLFTVPPKRLLALCDLMCESGLNKKLRWGCYARPNDLANLEFAERMREAGCEYVYVGFESGSDDVLQFMNKKCTVSHSARAIENTRKVGILTFGLFISGFPGETQQMFEQTRQFLRDSPPSLVSIVPWFPDVSDDTKVPIMRPDRIDRFRINVEHPSTRTVTMWKDCTFRAPMTVPWGLYWQHQGMELQEAVDNVSTVVQEIYDKKIRAVSEELFFPRILDDLLNMYQRLGADRMVDFYLGLSSAVLGNTKDGFLDWCQQVGLVHQPAAV